MSLCCDDGCGVYSCHCVVMMVVMFTGVTVVKMVVMFTVVTVL